MKKIKLVAIILAVVMLAGILFAIPVSAKAPAGNVPASRDSSYCGNLRYMLAVAVADAANHAIDELVEDALNDPDADALEVAEQAQYIADAATFVINMLGYDTVCEYTEYVINGVAVMIDPLIVIKR